MKQALLNIGIIISVLIIFMTEGVPELLSIILCILLIIIRAIVHEEIEEEKWKEELKRSEQSATDREWMEFYREEDYY